MFTDILTHTYRLAPAISPAIASRALCIPDPTNINPSPIALSPPPFTKFVARKSKSFANRQIFEATLCDKPTISALQVDLHKTSTSVFCRATWSEICLWPQLWHIFLVISKNIFPFISCHSCWQLMTFWTVNLKIHRKVLKHPVLKYYLITSICDRDL